MHERRVCIRRQGQALHPMHQPGHFPLRVALLRLLTPANDSKYADYPTGKICAG